MTPEGGVEVRDFAPGNTLASDTGWGRRRRC
jgi:hypothetical protein